MNNELGGEKCNFWDPTSDRRQWHFSYATEYAEGLNSEKERLLSINLNISAPILLRNNRSKYLGVLNCSRNEINGSLGYMSDGLSPSLSLYRIRLSFRTVSRDQKPLSFDKNISVLSL